MRSVGEPGPGDGGRAARDEPRQHAQPVQHRHARTHQRVGGQRVADRRRAWSISRTSSPARARRIAVAAPAQRAPTIRTSQVSGLTASVASLTRPADRRAGRSGAAPAPRHRPSLRRCGWTAAPQVGQAHHVKPVRRPRRRHGGCVPCGRRPAGAASGDRAGSRSPRTRCRCPRATRSSDRRGASGSRVGCESLQGRRLSGPSASIQRVDGLSSRRFILRSAEAQRLASAPENRAVPSETAASRPTISTPRSCSAFRSSVSRLSRAHQRQRRDAARPLDVVDLVVRGRRTGRRDPSRSGCRGRDMCRGIRRWLADGEDHPPPRIARAPGRSGAPTPRPRPPGPRPAARSAGRR